MEHSDTEITVPYNPKLVIVFIEIKAERSSNLLFVNNPFAIAARLKGREEDKENWKTSTGNLNLKYLFSRFNTETGVKKKTSGSNKSFVTGFWKLPNYFRGHNGGGVINLDDFIRKRTSRFKGIKDEESDGQHQTSPKKSKNKKHRISNPQPDELTIRQQSKRLLNNIKILQSEGGFNKINQKRWLDALFRLLHYILSNFEGVEKIEIDAVERVIEMLNNVSRISVWMASSFDIKLLKDRHIEILRCVLDIYKVLTLYQYARFLQYNFFDPYDKKSVELFTSAKRGFFYSNIIEEEFFERIKFSEHNFLSVEDLVSKLPNKKQAYKIFTGFQNKTWHSFKDVVEQSKAHSRKTKNGRQWLMRLKSTNQAYHLEELLGNEVVVSKKRNKGE